MKGSILLVAIFSLLLLVIPMGALRATGTQGQSATDSKAEETTPAPSAIAENDSVPITSTLPRDIPSATAGAAPAGENKNEDKDENNDKDGDTEEITIVAVAEPAAAVQGVLSFRVLNTATGRVEEVPLRDYVRGAVAAEMPVTFHAEALKAQAVAAHTYALYQHYFQQKNPDPALKGADFAADPANRKGYATEEAARVFYGTDYADAYWARICAAADSALPYVMAYEEQPIVAAYHAMSAGQTEAAENVWLGGTEYLVQAQSEWDALAPDYETRRVFPVQQMRALVLAAQPDSDLSGDPAAWFAQPVYSPSGYLMQMDVGGITLHGKDIRAIFSLRSHHMDISYDASTESFTFTVRGYGHGVGLSQYGADYLARQGYSFDEILAHYYHGIGISSIEAIE